MISKLLAHITQDIVCVKNARQLKWFPPSVVKADTTLRNEKWMKRKTHQFFSTYRQALTNLQFHSAQNRRHVETGEVEGSPKQQIHWVVCLESKNRYKPFRRITSARQFFFCPVLQQYIKQCYACKTLRVSLTQPAPEAPANSSNTELKVTTGIVKLEHWTVDWWTHWPNRIPNETSFYKRESLDRLNRLNFFFFIDVILSRRMAGSVPARPGLKLKNSLFEKNGKIAPTTYLHLDLRSNC